MHAVRIPTKRSTRCNGPHAVQQLEGRDHNVANSDADTIRRAYDAFALGDMDTIRSDAFAADIRWHQGGRNQLPATTRGLMLSSVTFRRSLS